MQLAIISAIFVAIFGVLFAMQNSEQVTVNLFIWSFDSSLAMMMLLAMVSGAIVVAFLTTPITLRWQWKLLNQKRRIMELERIELDQRKQISDFMDKFKNDDVVVEMQKPYVGLKKMIVDRLPD